MRLLFIFLALLLYATGASAEPVSAIAAIASIAGSGGAIAGVMGGIGLAGATLAEGAMLAGGALSLLGNVTGNKNLMKFGNIVGIAGGLGTLGTKLAADAGAAGLTEAGIEGAAAGTEGAVAGAEGAAQAEAAGLGTADLSGGGLGGGTAIGLPAGGETGAIIPSAQQSGALAAQTATVAGQQPSAFGQALGWLNKNPAAVNLAGGILKGGAEAYGAGAARQSQIDQAQQARERYNASITGMAPVGDFINPNANITAGVPQQNPVRYVPPGILRQATTPPPKG